MPRLDKLIHESVDLTAQSSAGVSFGNQSALIHCVRGFGLEIPIIAARNQILCTLGISESETLNIEIELEHLERLAGYPTD